LESPNNTHDEINAANNAVDCYKEARILTEAGLGRISKNGRVPDLPEP